MRNTYINCNLNPLTKFAATETLEFKGIFPWNISQIITETVPVSMRIVIGYVIKQGIPFWFWWKVHENWNNNVRIPLSRESHCRTNTSIKRKKEIQKSRTVRVTVRDPSRKVYHMSRVIWDFYNFYRLFQVYEFYPEYVASLYDGY